jgi:hypothetical protein
MSIRIDVHHFFHPADEAILHRIEAKMSALSDKLDTLTSDVSGLPTIVQSVKALLEGLNAIIADLKSGTTDPAQLARIDEANAAIEAAKGDLVAAVTANTPAS